MAARKAGRTYNQLVGEIVELANEQSLPNAERLSEYRASRVPRIVHRLSANEPYYKDLEVVRLAEGVADLRSPHLDPQQARLWVPHLPALIAEELGIYERDESFEAAVAQLAT